MKEKDIIIYGRHPVVDAISSGQQIDKVWLMRGLRGETEIELRKLCKEHDIPLQYVPKEKLQKISNQQNHQGIVAFAALIQYAVLENLLPHLFDQGLVPALLVLDGITDVRNFGAIARTAECAGFHAIVVPQTGTALINAEAMKTSAGALNFIPVCRVKNLLHCLEWLQMSGVQIVASSLEQGKSLYEVDLLSPTAFVLGAEDVGVSRHLLKVADEKCTIPQFGKTDSYNVSVAAGMLMYELNRQRLLSV